MTTAQIFACAAAVTTVIVTITAYVLVRRRRARLDPVEWTFDGNVITFDQPLTERQVEEFKARWLKLHGKPDNAHQVKPLDEEETGA